jgi:hypothetical protein
VRPSNVEIEFASAARSRPLEGQEHWRANIFGVQSRVVALTIVISTFVASRAGAAGATVAVLHEESLAVEEGRLIEALRIYTRDLPSRVRVVNVAPTVLTPAALEQIEREATQEDASVVLWAHRRDDGQAIFYMFDVRAHDLRETEMAPLGVDRAAMEVALKARALLVLTDARADPLSSPRDGRASGAEARRPSPAAGTREPSAEEGAPPSGAPPLPAPPPLAASGPPAVEAHPPPTPPHVLSRYALGASFVLISPPDTTWLRMGLAVTAAVRLGRLRTSHLWLTLDGALTNLPHTQVNGFEVTLRDLPLAAGVRAGWSSPRVGFVVGPRTTLHVLDVDAGGSDGRTGASRRYTVGLGGVASGELRLSDRLRATLGMSVEGLVPTQEFTVASQPALATGSILLGATAGIEVLIP